VAPNTDVDETLVAIRQRLDEVALMRGGASVSDIGLGDGDLSELLGEDGAEYRVVADRSHAAYCAQVSAALEAIARGDFEKVVVARSLEVLHPGHFALPRFLATLRARYPSCATFAVGRGDDTLIAATPERLVALRGDKVVAAALAGSAPRGRTPDEDAALGRALRESKKDQAEHETVVRAVRASLLDVCGPLEGPETPELLPLDGIQHLHTPMRGKLAAPSVGGESLGVLDLVARLHPTPAVGGLPQAPALDWLAHNEHLDRGWYAGPVGYVDSAGSGEFWLALRTALVHDPPTAGAPGEASSGEHARARLFAGAGIVQGSDPALELAETRLKLRALLAPLTEI
jgi:isochorismate synthase